MRWKGRRQSTNVEDRRGMGVPGGRRGGVSCLGLLVILVFFCGFWLRGGQTLGMRAWRLMVVRDDGSPLTLRDALVRFASAVLSWAALGIGFLWSLFDRENLAWHDRLSGTRLVILEKPKKRGLIWYLSGHRRDSGDNGKS